MTVRQRLRRSSSSGRGRRGTPKTSRATRIPVDYIGLPLNDEGRTRALTYNESQLAMIERQCEGWPQFYFVQGPFGLRIWSDTEPIRGHDDLVHDRRLGRSRADDRSGWTAGRNRRSTPSTRAAASPPARWEGNTLVARTTHMKAGFLRKNGPPSSDQATMTSRFFRHGDILTVLTVIEDPIYLAEPHIISKSFQLVDGPDLADRSAMCLHLRGASPRREHSALPAREESVRRRAHEDVRPSPRRGARPTRDALPGVSQDHQGEVRGSRAVHSKLRRRACPLAHSSDVYWRDRPGHHGVGDCRPCDGGGSPRRRL